MPLNPQLVYMPPFEIQLWDRDLNVPLAGGVVTFYEDNNHDVLKSVYQLVGDGEGSYSYVELPNPLILSGIGTFVDTSGNNLQVYMYPYVGAPTDNPPSGIVDLYYLTIYSSTNVLQETVNAWPPGLIANAPPVNEADTTGNIIQNSQFTNVSFNPLATSGSPVTFSTSGPNVATQIAPDWYVVTSGTGSFSVYQQSISDSTAPGNPAYALGITSASYSQPLILRQRIYAPRIFSGALVSGTFIAEDVSGGPYTLTMSYVPSGTGTPQTICSGQTPDTAFGIIANTDAVLITSGAAGSAPSAYVDITITIPVGASIQISNIQLCGVSSVDEAVAYLQNTPEEEVNGLFHYYQPQLNFKPVSSLLTGWDFPLNPQQFNVSSFGSTANAPVYVWDQTVCASAVSTVNVSKVSATGGFEATTTVDTEAFYLLQYLSGEQALKTTLSNLSVNINAYTDVHSGVTFNVYLYYSSGGGTIPTTLTTGSPTTIGTIANTGLFTLTASGWTLISQLYGTNSSGTLSAYSSTDNNYGFNGWNGKANFGTTATANFAIVVTFAVPTSGTEVLIDSISLVPGDIPTIPAPQSADEVLRQCQYYYETSYSSVSDFTSNPTNNSVSLIQSSLFNSSNATAFASPGWVSYKTTKRTNPNVTFYSVAGTSANVSTYLYYNNGGTFTTKGPTDTLVSSFWSVSQKINSLYLTPTSITGLLSNSATTAYNSAGIQFHYVLDARLGVV